jgi:hypothetical protein
MYDPDIQNFSEDTDEGRRGRVLTLMNDINWHSTAEISSTAVGGTEGTRRLRELRALGYTVEKRKVAGSTQYEYRFVR